jgi:hypothetical protein
MIGLGSIPPAIDVSLLMYHCPEPDGTARPSSAVTCPRRRRRAPDRTTACSAISRAPGIAASFSPNETMRRTGHLPPRRAGARAHRETRCRARSCEASRPSWPSSSALTPIIETTRHTPVRTFSRYGSSSAAGHGQDFVCLVEGHAEQMLDLLRGATSGASFEGDQFMVDPGTSQVSSLSKFGLGYGRAS